MLHCDAKQCDVCCLQSGLTMNRVGSFDDCIEVPVIVACRECAGRVPALEIVTDLWEGPAPIASGGDVTMRDWDLK